MTQSAAARVGFPIRLSEHLFIVGGGAAGVGLTCDLDSNVYLVDCGGGFVLVDCGVGIETERILTNIDSIGFEPGDCRGVLITHAHADHAGGAFRLSGALRAEPAALKESADYITRGDADAIALKAAIRAGVYPRDYVFRPCPVRPLDDNAELVFGDVKFSVISTPGHCSGHAVYYVKIDGCGVLFAGDLIFPGGKISLQPIWDCSIEAYAASIAKIAAMEDKEDKIDALLPAHYGFSMSGAAGHIRKAHLKFQKLSVPPNAHY